MQAFYKPQSCVITGLHAWCGAFLVLVTAMKRDTPICSQSTPCTARVSHFPAADLSMLLLFMFVRSHCVVCVLSDLNSGLLQACWAVVSALWLLSLCCCCQSHRCCYFRCCCCCCCCKPEANSLTASCPCTSLKLLAMFCCHHVALPAAQSVQVSGAHCGTSAPGRSVS